MSWTRKIKNFRVNEEDYYPNEKFRCVYAVLQNIWKIFPETLEEVCTFTQAYLISYAYV